MKHYSGSSKYLNPFYNPLVAERLESNPAYYRRLFSPRVLIGETIEIFQPLNAVLLGPQGCGKTMLLNLMKYNVLSEWLQEIGKVPDPLNGIAPFFGISVNLVRSNFHAFGRRSISRIARGSDHDNSIELSCAADYLNHFLFREYLFGLRCLFQKKHLKLRRWLGIYSKALSRNKIVHSMSNWKCWNGYYSDCQTIGALIKKCDNRLDVWISFINARIDEVPRAIWDTKASLGVPIHEMGLLLSSLGRKTKLLPLYIIIDQYEVLPELNKKYGVELQRIVNTLIKSRDSVVFYKIGARTHDWGRELRIWGADSRIEVQRDYVIANLGDAVMRHEDSDGWIFPEFAKDVVYKRLTIEGEFSDLKLSDVNRMFGGWSLNEESEIYFERKPHRRYKVLKKLPDNMIKKIIDICGKEATSLELRLAGAWVLQKIKRKESESNIILDIERKPWTHDWWSKERKEISVLQIASCANQKRVYYGWWPIVYLSGGNITCLLDICAEIWDMAIKRGKDPINKMPIDLNDQTDGIYAASEKWLSRDYNEEVGGKGQLRYQVLSRLGPAIHEALVGDFAISNPGHSGFSLREPDLWNSNAGREVRMFLDQGVNFAVFEERRHTSKQSGDVRRRKWYLHPLLSPTFGIPYKRTKEPFYSEVDNVLKWIYGDKKIIFRSNKNK
jgi:hypothetical protein